MQPPAQHVEQVDIGDSALPGEMLPTEQAPASSYHLTPQTAKVQSLLSADGLRFLFTSFVSNFTGFTAVGIILVVMIPSSSRYVSWPPASATAVPPAIAKWALLAPIFMPLFMRLGIESQTVPAAYRVADSPINVVNPIMPYFPLIVVFAKRYDRNSAIGTVTAMMLPYFLTLTVLRTLFSSPSGTCSAFRSARARPFDQAGQRAEAPSSLFATNHSIG